MRFRVDPWDPSYGTGLDAELGASHQEVDAAVERPVQDWAPVPPDARLAPPPVVLFVDGVRRVDAQVWLDEPGGAAPGLCASYAAGVVRCGPGGARLHAAHVRRGLFTIATAPEDVATTAGTYRAAQVAEKRGTAPMQLLSLALQNALGEVELLAAADARDREPGGEDLLVVDGPLRGRQHLARTIGFVKTHRSEYLPAELGALVARLGAGERTPVFRLGTSWERHTWYLRLPCAVDTPWAGVVRVECSADLPAAQVARFASVSQVTLPRYASTEYKDSRAPQNLYPIAGLERGLRRRMGEQALVYRALRRAALAAEPESALSQVPG
jgi:hypothetical protein